MQALKPLADQVIVITGASSGIGRATALAAARRDARVVLAAREGDALHALADQIRRTGGRALAAPTDVSIEGDVRRLAERAVDTFGRIDTWVNNAGVAVYGTVEQVTAEQYARVMAVNFLGQVYGCRAALPHLRTQRRGAIICIGSALSDRAIPLQAAYCASKHAVKALTESLRVELRQEGSEIQVTLIKPSSFTTPLFDQAATHMGVKPKPMAPVYDPTIAARAILYAAEHRVRDLPVGGGAKLLTTLEATAGPVLDWWLTRAGARGQQSQERKSEQAPNNLARPLAGAASVRGSYRGRRLSAYTTARLHPRLTVASAVGAVTAVVAWRAHRHGAL